jgi:hypothetical protein
MSPHVLKNVVVGIIDFSSFKMTIEHLGFCYQEKIEDNKNMLVEYQIED